MLDTIEQVPIGNLYLFKNDPKRRSYLDIQRMCDSMMKIGFINPVLYWESGKTQKRYVVDGICRILGLMQLLDIGKWPKSPFRMKKGMVPGIKLDVSKNEVKEIIISSHASFSVMTEKTLRNFVGDSNIELHHYAFPEGALIDFYEEKLDVSPYFTDIKRVAKKNERLGSLLV